ncbi:hypothetical protein [Acinetobacter sp. 251-1]|uniref:hypothetical protein n=1 Tax=Acinetobacter sp. 251-1 TaxID=2746720 RepID=UPI00257531FE|nr:hypothetical protein [Acinetobacter sp. 251-1]MDM1761576.1 hypothetical protein [Acinetobacter sp. 251-1]
MKLNKKILLMAFTIMSLTGCDKVFSKHIKCDDVNAVGLVQKVLKDNLDKTLEHDLKSLINRQVIKDLDPTKLKLSSQNIQYSLLDSRTDHIDPDSTKTKCSIDLTVTLPSDIVKKSDEARAMDNASSVDEQAEKLDLDLRNNKIQMVLSYIIQPTDKGDKVIATVSNSENMNRLTADTLTYAFLKSQFEKNKVRYEQVRQNTQSDDGDEYYQEDVPVAADAAEAAIAAADATAAADAKY